MWNGCNGNPAISQTLSFAGVWSFQVKIFVIINFHVVIWQTFFNCSSSCTVCWIGVKVAVLCAWKYMSWNTFLIKVLNKFWYFEHSTLTIIYLEAYLKRDWRNCIQKLYFFTSFKGNFFNYVSNMLPSKS